MRNVFRMLLLMVALAVGTYTFAAQAQKGGQAPQQDKVFQGTLVKVDAEAKTITAKDADNKEMIFHYTEKTEMRGSEKTVQGLAGKAGSKVNITYTVERGNNNATSVESLP